MLTHMGLLRACWSAQLWYLGRRMRFATRATMRSACAGLAVAGTLAVMGCDRETTANTAPAPRPVTALELREIDPVQPLQLTGSVEAWKEQDVAFEVSGRVELIEEPGKQLEGRCKARTRRFRPPVQPMSMPPYML